MTAQAEHTIVEFLSLLDVDHPDIGKLMGYMTPDAAYLNRVRHAEPLRGRAVEEELSGQFSRYRDCQCKIHAISSNEAQVFTERSDTVTMRSDGRKVTVLVCGVFDVNAEGKITYWREYWDMADIEAQMAAAPRA
jgi:limonene-1,2-epoxide hydrolase